MPSEGTDATAPHRCARTSAQSLSLLLGCPTCAAPIASKERPASQPSTHPWRPCVNALWSTKLQSSRFHKAFVGPSAVGGVSGSYPLSRLPFSWRRKSGWVSFMPLENTS